MLAIASSGPQMSDLVDPRFGRAPWFLLCDAAAENPVCTPHANPHVGDSSGVGPRVAGWLETLGVQAIISGAVGPKVAPLLREIGCTTYHAENMTAAEALAGFRTGRLSAGAG